MAFTRAPMEATSKTVQIPLIYQWDNRRPSSVAPDDVDPKQTVAQNVYFESVQSESTGEAFYNVIKRDGTEVYQTTTEGGILGVYYWQLKNWLVVVTPTNIKAYSTINGALAVNTAYTWDTPKSTTAGVGFTEFLYESGDVKLIIASTVNFGTLDQGGVWTVATDADRPQVTQDVYAYPVFLDGYLFFCGVDGNIYNSNLNDPLAWTAGNLISVESYPDKTQAIARVGNYIVALGTSSTEWFYDAANPTGTPLARVDGATKEIGYIQGLAQTEGSIYFVGRSAKSGASIYKIEGLKIMDIGTPTIRRWLTVTAILPNTRGHVVIMGGHRFYLVTQNRNTLTPIQTYMFDLDNSMASSLILGSATQGPFIFASATIFESDLTTSYGAARTVFVEFGSGVVYSFRDQVYQDNLVNYTCKFVTRPLDFGNRRTKFCSRLVFDTDQTSSTSTMSVSWSDDDMVTYTTPRTVDLSHVYEPLYQGGSFRKRSFRITYADDFPMRWRSVEIDYEQGQT